MSTSRELAVAAARALDDYLEARELSNIAHRAQDAFAEVVRALGPGASARVNDQQVKVYEAALFTAQNVYSKRGAMLVAFQELAEGPK